MGSYKPKLGLADLVASAHADRVEGRFQGAGVLATADPPMTELPTSTPPAGPTPTARTGFLVKYGKFLVVGLTGVVVNLLIFTLVLEALAPGSTPGFLASITHLLTQTSSNPAYTLIASAIAFVGATFWNFALNNAWTFRTHLPRRHALGYRLALYFVVSLGSLAVNELILFLTSSTLPPLYGQGIGIIAGSIVGFAGNARITFAEAEAVRPT